MERMNKNKIIFIVITILAFLMLISGGILIIVSIMIKTDNLIYIGLPLICVSFVTYIILFIILVVFFKKKE